MIDLGVMLGRGAADPGIRTPREVKPLCTGRFIAEAVLVAPAAAATRAPGCGRDCDLTELCILDTEACAPVGLACTAASDGVPVGVPGPRGVPELAVGSPGVGRLRAEAGCEGPSAAAAAAAAAARVSEGAGRSASRITKLIGLAVVSRLNKVKTIKGTCELGASDTL